MIASTLYWRQQRALPEDLYLSNGVRFDRGLARAYVIASALPALVPQ